MLSACRSWMGLTVVVAGLLACGQPRYRGLDDQPFETDRDPQGCQDNRDCVSGVCNTDTGLCTSPDSCTTHGQCGNNQYCHFVNPPTPWVPGTQGECSPPCASDNDCSIGQACQNGRCYSLIDCVPANNNADCPPGEVCNDQSRTCTAPPSQCTWPEDCPVGWICNTDNTCLDPDDVDLGGCTATADCNNIASCANNSCECNSGSCRPIGGCSSYLDCPSGNYCAQGLCRPATSCTGSNAGICGPLGLVCVGGVCVDQPSCTTGGCPAGLACVNGLCRDPNANECARNDQCPAGQYCELFTGTCEPGCRSNSDCVGQCPGAAACNCASNHQCSTSGAAQQGDPCTSQNDCGAGLACAYTDQMAALMCSMGGGLPGVGFDCEARECRVVCDLALSLIEDPCPAGQSCGGSASGLDAVITTIMLSLMEAMMGGGTPTDTVAVCF